MYVWIYILFNRNTGRTHRLAMLHAALIWKPLRKITLFITMKIYLGLKPCLPFRTQSINVKIVLFLDKESPC